jgi:hypothetical protein
MIPQSLKSSVSLFLVGGFVVALGVLVAGVGFQIKSRAAERHLDRLYVLRRRGEDPPAEEPPRFASILEYVGGAVAFIGVVVLVAAWTSSAGQS